MNPNRAQRQFIWKQIGYTPYPLQAPPLMDETSRVILVTGGERAGKSRLMSALGTSCLLFSNLIWIVGPDFQQARPEFEYMMLDAVKLGAASEKDISMPKEGPCMFVSSTGCVVETKTAADVMKLAGKAPNLVLMTEAAQSSFEVFLKLRGRVAEKRGLLMLGGTLEESSQWYVDLYNLLQGENVYGGKSYSVPSWANLGVYPGGRLDPEIVLLERTLPESLFLERHAAVPRKSSLLVHPEFDFTVHVDSKYEYSPDLPVVLAIDPGYAGAYAILACHVVGRDIWAFDEVYLQRPETGTLKMIEDCRKRNWWTNVDDIVIDVAGYSANLSDGKSVASHWLEQTKADKLNGGRGIMPRGQRVGIQDGIDRYRIMLGNPKNPDTARLHYHPRCAHTINEHQLYRYPKRSSFTHSDAKRPIDRNNHGLKAMVYLIIDKMGYYDGAPPATQIRMALSNENLKRYGGTSEKLPAEFME